MYVITPFRVFVVFAKEFFHWFYRPAQTVSYTNEVRLKRPKFLPPLMIDYLCIERVDIATGAVTIVYQKPGAEKEVENLRSAWKDAKEKTQAYFK